MPAAWWKRPAKGLRNCLELAGKRHEERDPEGCLQAAGEGLRLAPVHPELAELQQWAVKTRRVVDRVLRSAERAAGRDHIELACRRMDLLVRIQPTHSRGLELRARYLEAWNRSTRADRLREAADGYFRCGELDTARQVAQAGIEMDPTNKRLPGLLEEVSQAIGRRDMCRRLMQEARAKVERDELVAAVELTEKILEIESDESEARDLRASLLVEQSAREKAEIFISAARRALQGGNSALCLKTLDHAKALYPRSPQIRRLERQALGPSWKRLLGRWGK